MMLTDYMIISLLVLLAVVLAKFIALCCKYGKDDIVHNKEYLIDSFLFKE